MSCLVFEAVLVVKICSNFVAAVALSAMDRFDDLLDPSRHVLEDNPFADPFLRSRSPDPWASYVHDDGVDHGYHLQSDVVEGQSGVATVDEPVSTGHIVESGAVAVDPLDAAARTTEEHEGEETKVASPERRAGYQVFTSGGDDAARVNKDGEARVSSDGEVKVSKDGEARVSKDVEPGVRSHDHQPSSSRPSMTMGSSSSSSPSPSAPVSAHNRTSSLLDPPSAVVSPLDHTGPLGFGQAFSGLGRPQDEWQSAWTTDPVFSTPVAATSSNVAADDDDDDDDDDTPIGQTAKFRGRSLDRGLSIQSSTSPPSAVVVGSDSAIPPLFVISVEDPQKVGDPIRSFIMYTVHTRTSSSLFSKPSFSVLRRYSDFLWLYETLSMNNPGVIVPPVPEKNTFGRFDENFVQQRRLALEKCIQKMANHAVLAKDPDLKFFLESDSFALDIKHRKSESAHERGGLMASIGQTLTGSRFHETDEWFDKQRAYLDGLESQLRSLVKSIDIAAKHRAELASATKDFATSVSELSGSDLRPHLKECLATLSNVEMAVAEAQDVQSQQDVITLMSTADEYWRLVSSVRTAFNSRVRTHANWQHADAEVRRARQMHERAKAQGRLPTDRVGHTVSLVAEAERRALDAKHDFDRCSKLIKAEMARFELERVEDFKIALQTFLDGMISRQKELIAGWEKYQHLLLSPPVPA